MEDVVWYRSTWSAPSLNRFSITSARLFSEPFCIRLRIPFRLGPPRHGGECVTRASPFLSRMPHTIGVFALSDVSLRFAVLILLCVDEGLHCIRSKTVYLVETLSRVTTRACSFCMACPFMQRPSPVHRNCADLIISHTPNVHKHLFNQAGRV